MYQSLLMALFHARFVGMLIASLGDELGLPMPLLGSIGSGHAARTAVAILGRGRLQIRPVSSLPRHSIDCTRCRAACITEQRRGTYEMRTITAVASL